MDRPTFGARVRAWREARGLRQTEVAARAGIAAVRLCRIEKGSRVATVEEMERLAIALGVAEGDLSTLPDAGGEAA